MAELYMVNKPACLLLFLVGDHECVVVIISISPMLSVTIYMIDEKHIVNGWIAEGVEKEFKAPHFEVIFVNGR